MITPDNGIENGTGSLSFLANIAKIFTLLDGDSKFTLGASPGNRSGYSFTKVVADFTLKDNVSNFSSDIVTNVERIKYADFSL